MAPLYRLRRRLGGVLADLGDRARLRARDLAWRAKPQARLLATLDLGDGGANDLWIADADADGRAELLAFQTQGIFKSSLYRQAPARAALLERGTGLGCLTAYRADGRVAWRFGEPYRGEQPYATHAGEQMVAAFQDADGNPRVAVLTAPDGLALLDGRDGSLLRAATLPADNFAIVQALVGPDGPRLLVGVTDLAHPPGVYGTPTLILDLELQVAGRFDALGAGHVCWVEDVDGDGRDEALIGYELFDAAGTRRWTLDAWAGRRDGYDPKTQHIDGASTIRLDGRWHAALAGSDQLYWIDQDGHVLWRHRPRHAQAAFVGYFGGGDATPSIVVVDSLTDTWLEGVSLGGERRWRRPAPASWPGGRPAGLRGARFHMGVPAVRWRAPKGAADRVVVAEAGWPYAVDGAGEVAVVFPWSDAAPGRETPPPTPRACDWGYAYQVRCGDLDGDGVDEVVVYDRGHAWIFRMPIEDL